MPTIWRILAVLAGWNSLLWLVLGALLAPVVPGGWLTVLALAAVLLLPVVILARGFGGSSYPSAATRILLYRPFWYCQLALPLLAAAGLLGIVAGLPFGASPAAGRAAVAGMGVLLLVLLVWGFVGTRRLVVRPLEFVFATLPPALDGTRIAQLSDLHVGPHTSRRHLARIAAAVRAADPHLIALTGDQVDDYARDVEPLGRSLGGLTAPLGVFAIPGNHDVYAGWTAVRAGMERLGWRVLVNEAMELERNGSRFWVVGTGDPAGRSGVRGGSAEAAPDVARALAAVPAGGFTLALAHNPALWAELAGRGVALTLSGHTHYGQLAIPRLRWSMASLFLTHAMDVYREGEPVLYINPGTNFWGVPFRIGALPEVTVVTLRSGAVARTPSGASLQPSARPS